MSEIVTEVRGTAGLITLNRPRALNALSLDMIRALTVTLLAWEDDPRVERVAVRGMGREGPFGTFCAGGDIRFFHQAVLTGDWRLVDFFTEEYSLNHLIHVYPKPYVVFMDGVVKDPDDPDRRLFLQIKNNIAKDPGGLAFRIGQQLLPGDIIGSSIFWDSERVSCTADQILAANENASDRPAQTEAEDFLRDILRDGPRPAKDIESEAKEAGISWRTVNRAKKALGVVAERKAESGDGFGGSGRWFWSLPR